MRRENRIKEFIFRSIGVLFIFLIVSYFIPTPYLVMSPGIAQELSPIITVDNGYKGQSRGDFMLTAVASKKASVLDYIYISLLQPSDKELTPLEQQIPPDMEMEEYINIMDKLMEESKLKAQAIAFEKAGYEVSVKGQGAVVEEIMKEGSAAGKLKKDDIIIEIDGREVELATDAVQLIREHEVNENVKITVLRDNQEKTFTLQTVELKREPGKASIGVLITTKGLDYNFPREVNFDTRNIIGPSAGGMFTLEIYNQLTKEDITSGKRIAGTGTINLDGSLGKIDGVKLKIMAAEKAGAELFILPHENYNELENKNFNIKLKPVKDIDEILTFLKDKF